MTITYTLTGVLAFTYATLTSKNVRLVYILPRTSTHCLNLAQQDITARIRIPSSVLVILFTLLALTPLIPISPTPFVFLILGLSILLSSCASYLQNGAAVLASLFGPGAMQSLMSGQGAVGILVSLVQLVTNALAVVRQRDGGDGDDANSFRLSAGLFFGFSTLVMVGTLVAHAGLMRMKLYKRVMASHLESRASDTVDGEASPLLASSSTDAIAMQEQPKQDTLWHIAKMNWQYNLAVAFVFTVTLVCPPLHFSVFVRKLTSCHHPVRLPADHIIHPLCTPRFFLPHRPPSPLQLRPLPGLQHLGLDWPISLFSSPSFSLEFSHPTFTISRARGLHPLLPNVQHIPSLSIKHTPHQLRPRILLPAHPLWAFERIRHVAVYDGCTFSRTQHEAPERECGGRSNDCAVLPDCGAEYR